MTTNTESISQALECIDEANQILASCLMCVRLYEIAHEPASIVCIARWLELLADELDELCTVCQQSWGASAKNAEAYYNLAKPGGKRDDLHRSSHRILA